LPSADAVLLIPMDRGGKNNDTAKLISQIGPVSQMPMEYSNTPPNNNLCGKNMLEAK